MFQMRIKTIYDQKMDNFFSIKNETENIVRIELTNGKKHNPLSLQLIKALTKALEDVSAQNKQKS